MNSTLEHGSPLMRKRNPHCEAFAYRNDEKWYWSLDDCEVKVEITAWKKKCEPYKAE